MYREYTDLSRRHDADVEAQCSQQQLNVESVHSRAGAGHIGGAGDDVGGAGDNVGGGTDAADTTKERLARMVRSTSLNYCDVSSAVSSLMHFSRL